MKIKLLSTLIAAFVFSGTVYGQSTPVSPTQLPAPTITTQSTTQFSTNVSSALSNSTTNIIYLEQTGTSPTININQDGNGNRAGSDANGNTNSMILDGSAQVVIIDQTGNNNVINTLQIHGDNANVYVQQLGNGNTANISCGLTTSCTDSSGANLDFRLDSTGKLSGNTLNYTGNGPALISALYVTGGGNAVTLNQNSTVGQQSLINLTGSDNNTVNLSQTSTGLSSFVLTQTGTGGTTFNVSQSGTYSNVANISAVSAGGNFNIIQKSR
jgi:hypothetical protein